MIYLCREMGDDEMRAFFFDYDGTIVDDNTKSMTKGTLQALQALHDQGDLVFVNTGRTKSILDPELYSLPLDGMILGCGTYVEYHGQILLDEGVPKVNHKDIVKIFKDASVDTFLEGKQNLYVSEHIQNPFLLAILARYQKNHTPVHSIEEDDKCFSKVFICYNDVSKKAETKQKLSTYFTYIDRGEDRAELVPKGFSKATGIQVILDHLGMNQQDCYVFGDSNNDLPMFEFIEHSILIGGGENPELSSKVMLSSDAASEDGITHALQKLNIL